MEKTFFFQYLEIKKSIVPTVQFVLISYLSLFILLKSDAYGCFTYMDVCTHMCAVPPGARRGRQIPWELQLQLVVHCYVGARIKLQGSGRAAIALNS